MSIELRDGEFLGVEIGGGVGGYHTNPFDYDDEGIFITKVCFI